MEREQRTNETNFDRQQLLTLLAEELAAMETRRPERRDPGYADPRDPKYHVLKAFARDVADVGFPDAYARLSDPEKHAIITRLQNRAHVGRVAHEHVDALERDLYGTEAYDGEVGAGILRQEALERELYATWRSEDSVGHKRETSGVLPVRSIAGDSHTVTHDGRTYDVYALIHEARELSVASVDVRTLMNALVDDECWDDANGKRIKPHDVIAAIRPTGEIQDWDRAALRHPELAKHITKVRNADYSHPILLSPDGVLLDGAHRVIKAYLEGQYTILARKLEKIPESALYA